MSNHPTVMIVEDEAEIARFLNASLQQAGYICDQRATAADALKTAAVSLPDLIILDLGLPDGDGKSVIGALRGWSRVPIIVLSARHSEDEKIAALDAGADDYLTKPFGTGELLARVKVALRHASRRERPADAVYTFEGLSIDFARRAAHLHGQALHLTPTEYSLLSLLARKAGQVVTQGEMLKEVWGRNAEENDHYLRIYIRKLRQKIGDDPLYPRYIFTEPGVGYRFAEDLAP